MLALAGVPGIYAHSLFGSHNEHQGYARSGWKHDLNHERLQLADLEQRLSDPCSEAAQVFARYARLLEVRRGHPAFHPQAPQRVLGLGRGVLALERGPREGQSVLALHNLDASPRPVELPDSDHLDAWVDLLSGREMSGGSPQELRPYEVVWLQRGVGAPAAR